MILSQLILTNFRSYSSREFSLSPEVTLVIGPNTSGKTNLLEAVYLLSTGKSLRAGVESEMIQWGKEWARVESQITTDQTDKSTDDTDLGVDFSVSSEVEIIGALAEKKSQQGKESDSLLCKESDSFPVSGEPAADESAKLEVFIEVNESNNHTRKQFKVNGVKKGLGEFQGALRVVVFSPESLRLVLGRPSRRRSYLNRVLSALDFSYFHTLEEYRKVVRNRNKLLWQVREVGISKARLEFWDEQLFDLGGNIYEARKEFIEELNRKLSDLGLGVRLFYQPSVLDRELYEERLPQEIGKTTTLWGPHRDDFRFERTRMKQMGTDENRSNLKSVVRAGRDLAVFGSRGEQREAVFGLCLAELEVVSERVGTRPILLLDDIFSELDEAHRKGVLQVLPRQQTIITSAEPELLNSGLMDKAKVIEL